jgi:hypothetical protein
VNRRAKSGAQHQQRRKVVGELSHKVLRATPTTTKEIKDIVVTFEGHLLEWNKESITIKGLGKSGSID